MENHDLGILSLIEGGPVGLFIKDVFKSAEKCSSEGDHDTAKNILDVCDDVLLAYKRAIMMTELLEERQSLVTQAEGLVTDHLLTTDEKANIDKNIDQEMNSAKAKRARQIIEGILKNDKKSS
jgi:hypothetical protein